MTITEDLVSNIRISQINEMHFFIFEFLNYIYVTQKLNTKDNIEKHCIYYSLIAMFPNIKLK